MVQTSRLLRPACAALAVAACAGIPDEPIDADALAHRSYALVRTGDASPPILVSAFQGDTTQLLADTITFLAPPRARRVTTYRYAWRGSPVRVETSRVDLEYRVRHDVVVIGSFAPCGPAALCAANLAGPATASDLRLVPDNGVPSPESRYVRVDVTF